MFILELVYDIPLVVVISETCSGCTNIRSSQPRRLAGENNLRKLQLHSSDKPYRYVFVEF